MICPLYDDDCYCEQHTTQYIRTDVRWTTTLVPQQVTVTNEMFTETKISDGYSASTRVEHHVAELQVSMNNVPLRQTHQTSRSGWSQTGDLEVASSTPDHSITG